MQGTPTLVQGSTQPILILGGTEDLKCARCGQVLVAGFRPRSLVAIAIECFGCKLIYEADRWPDSEPLPAPAVSLGREGRFLIKGTLQAFDKPVVITTDFEIERIAALTGIRPAFAGPLEFSEGQLMQLVAKLDRLSNGGLGKEMRSVERASARGSAFLKCLPAWALHRLLGCAKAQALDVASDDLIALRLLQLITQLISRWEHHPLFPRFVQGLVSEFPHAIGMLLSASYLADVGNNIGFTDVRAVVGRSPDLYLNINAQERAAIEIKAPSAFQWPNTGVPTARTAEDIIERQLRDAKGQMGASGGVVVIVCNSLRANFRNVTEAAARSLIGRKRVHRRIAAVMGVCQSAFSLKGPDLTGNLLLEGYGDIWVCKNPGYQGPISLASADLPKSM